MRVSGRAAGASFSVGAAPIFSMLNNGKFAMARPCGCVSHSANERQAVTTSPASAAAVSNASSCPPPDSSASPSDGSSDADFDAASFAVGAADSYLNPPTFAYNGLRDDESGGGSQDEQIWTARPNGRTINGCRLPK